MHELESFSVTLHNNLFKTYVAMELITFCIVITAFICIFTFEVIAPASKNHCDRRWMLLNQAFDLLLMPNEFSAY